MKSVSGLGALDILITVLVLAVLLLTARHQFDAYEGLSANPAGRVDSAESVESVEPTSPQ